jgi:hypothetical protein
MVDDLVEQPFYRKSPAMAVDKEPSACEKTVLSNIH